MVNSLTVGTDGGGGASVVRGVKACWRGLESSHKITSAAMLMPPTSIARIASAASNLRMVCIYSPAGQIVTVADVMRIVTRVVEDGVGFARFIRVRARFRPGSAANAITPAIATQCG